MAITKRLTEHEHCKVTISRTKAPHYGKLYCVYHKKHIQWLGKRDYEYLLETVPGIEYKHLKADTKATNGVKTRPSRKQR
jgi:hypothetical protein